MASPYPCIAVQTGKIRRTLFGYKIFQRLISLVSQTASNNLLDLPVVNIYAWPEFHLIHSFHFFYHFVFCIFFSLFHILLSTQPFRIPRLVGSEVYLMTERRKL